MNPSAVMMPSSPTGSRRRLGRTANAQEVPDVMPPQRRKLKGATRPLRLHAEASVIIYDARGQQVVVMNSKSVKGQQTAVGMEGHELAHRILAVPQLWEDADCCVLTNALRLMKSYALSCSSDKNWKKLKPGMLDPFQILSAAGLDLKSARTTVRRLQRYNALQKQGDTWLVSRVIAGFSRDFSPLLISDLNYNQPLPNLPRRYKRRPAAKQGPAPIGEVTSTTLVQEFVEAFKGFTEYIVRNSRI